MNLSRTILLVPSVGDDGQKIVIDADAITAIRGFDRDHDSGRSDTQSLVYFHGCEAGIAVRQSYDDILWELRKVGQG